jgi:phosphoglycerol geranylgeranyltransferase
MAVLDAAARGTRTLVRAVGSLARMLPGANANPAPAGWDHVTKVDPEHEKQLPLLYPLYLHHTDAVSVGGSRDVTARNTEETFDLLEWAPVPAIHEPSDPAHVTERTREQCAFIAIPEVLNGDSASLVGQLGAGIERIRGTLLPGLLRRRLPSWVPDDTVAVLADLGTDVLLDRALFEAYIIQNPESAAARETNVTAADCLTPEGARQHALAAERRLGSEIVYVEYSGTYGGEEAEALLEAIDDTVSWPRLWYGGGIETGRQARRMHDVGADAVVVGDLFHRLAAEERRLYERLSDELAEEYSEAVVTEWVADTVDVGETTAVNYLATTGVADPTEQARQYLVATLTTALAIDARATENSESVGYDTPAGRYLRPLVGDDAEPFSAALTAGLLDAEAEFPGRHIWLRDSVDG